MASTFGPRVGSNLIAPVASGAGGFAISSVQLALTAGQTEGRDSSTRLEGILAFEDLVGAAQTALLWILPPPGFNVPLLDPNVPGVYDDSYLPVFSMANVSSTPILAPDVNLSFFPSGGWFQFPNGGPLTALIAFNQTLAAPGGFSYRISVDWVHSIL